MLKTLRVVNREERERFCKLTGLTPLTEPSLARSDADAHWLLEGEAGSQGRCSLWWSNVPCISGQRAGLIGHYAASDIETARLLFQHVCAELAHQGCTLAIGPLDGNTNRRYRLLSERGTEPPFFLEPDNPDDWPAHFTTSGFTVLANYYSALQVELDWKDPQLPLLAEQFAREGITLRTLEMDQFEEEVRRISRVVCASFRANFLASPLAEEDLLEQYRPLRPFIRPELILLAEQSGEVVGFVFSLPDWLQAQRGTTINTFIVKTLAVHPDFRSKGLATLLTGRLREIAYNLGYTRAIHALMHEQNISRRVSHANRGKIIRRYTLYARTLEEWS